MLLIYQNKPRLLSCSTMEKFTPTEEMLEAALLVITSQALTNEIRDVVTENKRKILADNNYRFKREHKEKQSERSLPLPEFVKDDNYSFLMEDDDFQDYLDKVFRLNLSSGLTVAYPNLCPLLAQESELRDHKDLLLKVMEPVLKVDISKLSQTNKKKLTELTLNFLVPQIPKERLNRVMKSIQVN